MKPKDNWQELNDMGGRVDGSITEHIIRNCSYLEHCKNSNIRKESE